MSRIDDRFAALKAEKRKALVIFLTAGDPTMKGSVDLAKAAFDHGADIVEIGVPFSDPLADGPVIQDSFLRAIAKGASVVKTFDAVRAIRKTHDQPLVFMIASTLVICHGTKKFMKESAACGVDGIIIPDAPLDEAPEFSEPARAEGLDTILLAAPTSTRARLKKIARLSTGFLYYINVTGVTGKSQASPTAVAKNVRAIKSLTKTPVLAGFGVTGPEQAAKLSRAADGVIVGSQAIRVIREAKNQKEAVKKLGAFVSSLRKGLDTA